MMGKVIIVTVIVPIHLSFNFNTLTWRLIHWLRLILLFIYFLLRRLIFVKFDFHLLVARFLGPFHVFVEECSSLFVFFIDKASSWELNVKFFSCPTKSIALFHDQIDQILPSLSSKHSYLHRYFSILLFVLHRLHQTYLPNYYMVKKG